MTNLDLLTLMLRAKVLTYTLTGDITTLEEFVLSKLDEFRRFPHSEGNRIAHHVIELGQHLREGLIDDVEGKRQLRRAFGMPST